jgi:hypothetical protein
MGGEPSTPAVSGKENRTMSIMSRVQEGAELLDEVRPRWDRNLDIVHFNVANGDPLAQIYGTYERGLKDPRLGLGGSQDMAAECGFQAYAAIGEGGKTSPEAIVEYQALTHSWLELLKAREAARPKARIRKVVARAKRRKPAKVS